MNKNNFKVINPTDGDMLNERDGKIIDDALVIDVKVNADLESQIYIDDKKARCKDGVYSAEVMLKSYSNNIKISDKITGEIQNITVHWLKNYTGKYRLSLDDNIWFIEDIAKNAKTYKSIFDNAYLSFLKNVHDKYDTKIHINIYYQTADGFNISQMPDKYKQEWQKNSDWIRLSFHARADKPDKPYINSSYEEVKKDCEMVLDEIKRFAGEELIGPVTTLHWGEATIEGCRALRDCGYKGLVADFNVDNEHAEKIPVSYYLDIEKRRKMYNRFIWKDTKEDIIFIRTAIIIDCHKIDGIGDFLDNIYDNKHQSPYLDLLIHEQYFYPHYINYQSNYKEKVLTAVKWAVDKGYEPAFLDECIF